MQVISFQKLLDNLLEKPALWRVFCYIKIVLKNEYLIVYLLINSFLISAKNINVNNIDIVRDSLEGNRSSKWSGYNKNDGKFSFQFNRRTILGEFFGTEDDTSENPYDLIVKDIKKN